MSTITPDRLDQIEGRLQHLEATVKRLQSRNGAQETAIEPWLFLVRRQHPWRKQLYLKGRNMTARQLVGAMQANRLDEAAVAADYRLPIEAVREATAYVEQNRELLATESESERLRTTPAAG